MTIPAELVAPVLIALTVVFSGWMVYEHRRGNKQAGYEADRLSGARKESMDLHQALLILASSLESRIATLEVPHSHETHTHELVKRSEHQEGGHLVVVKTCTSCDAVFRDKQA